MSLHITAVNYLNTVPFTAGLARALPATAYRLALKPPAACAADFLSGAADLALVPAAALLALPEVHLLDGYCIGGDGPVESVLLLAERPVAELTAVVADPESKTSNGLTRLLLAQYWQRQVAWRTDCPPLGAIGGTVGGVVIGDKALRARLAFPYAYDLSAEWYAWKRLPFVFAVWVVRAGLPADRLLAIRRAFGEGIANRATLAADQASKFGHTRESAARYVTKAVRYAFGARQQTALMDYLQALATLEDQTVPALQYLGAESVCC